MNKTKITEITRLAVMFSLTAVMGDLMYIICRTARPAVTLDDLLFLAAVPEMLESMLLSAVIVMAFLAVMTYIAEYESDL